ncbi:MAG: homoserine dehydrogenase [Eubacteriales bacterium]
MRKVKIALLGIGNVGGGVYRILNEDKASILHRENVECEIKYVLVRDVNKPRDLDLPKNLLIDDFDLILNDDEIEIVAEFMGGIEPAKEYLLKSMQKGKSVVTANKEVIAKHWPVLNDTAKANGVGLFFEPSVAGGIPVLKTLWSSMQGNDIESIYGIINGTTNYILSRMTDEGLSYEEALKEAKQLGYAEPDPTNDVEGYDAMFKLSILSSLAFHAKIPVEKIYLEGITGVSSIDIDYAKELGYVVKLLAIGKKKGDIVEVRVHPTIIKNTHPLASVSGAYNAVFLKGSAVGGLMLYGQGAGRMPTASAAVSDIICAVNPANFKYTTFENTYELPKGLTFSDDWECGYYIRVSVYDRPGVLASLADVFGRHKVSIQSVMQTGQREDKVPLRIVTHQAKEKSVKQTIEDIKALDGVIAVDSLIRVEEDI